MSNFKVLYYGDCDVVSEVYAIDAVRDRFLIVDFRGWFRRVSTSDCKPYEEEE